MRPRGAPADSRVPGRVRARWGSLGLRLESVPNADPAASPKHVSSDYYYRIPVRPIYKGYPVYAYGHEPPGYLEWLKQQEPIIVWDEKGRAPTLQTDAGWIRAGEIVFDAPVGTGANAAIGEVQSKSWLAQTRAPVAADGTLPWFQYVVRRKGTVELQGGSCAFCHSPVMHDGRVLKGAQGNLPSAPRCLWVACRERCCR